MFAFKCGRIQIQVQEVAAEGLTLLVPCAFLSMGSNKGGKNCAGTRKEGNHITGRKGQ